MYIHFAPYSNVYCIFDLSQIVVQSYHDWPPMLIAPSPPSQQPYYRDEGVKMHLADDHIHVADHKRPEDDDGEEVDAICDGVKLFSRARQQQQEQQQHQGRASTRKARDGKYWKR
jgi:hypothetical protein